MITTLIIISAVIILSWGFFNSKESFSTIEFIDDVIFKNDNDNNDIRLPEFKGKVKYEQLDNEYYLIISNESNFEDKFTIVNKEEFKMVVNRNSSLTQNTEK